MSNFDLWIKACQEFGTCIYKLGDGFYKTWRERRCNERDYESVDIMYHVWDGDRRIYCGRDYITGVRVYHEVRGVQVV